MILRILIYIFDSLNTMCICEHGLENLTKENLKEMLTFANAAASLITIRKGALRVMPELEEIEDLLSDR